MFRELIVTVYLIVFKILFNIAKVFPLKNKVTFIMSYGENLIFIYEEMQKQHVNCEVVFLYKSTCKYEVKSYPDVKSFAFETKSIVQTIQAAYHLATSQHVIIDNYFDRCQRSGLKAGYNVSKFGMRRVPLKNSDYWPLLLKGEVNTHKKGF